jgi:hypothetical protein
MNNIFEISSIRDISGYLKIYQDISGYPFGANSQMAELSSGQIVPFPMSSSHC